MACRFVPTSRAAKPGSSLLQGSRLKLWWRESRTLHGGRVLAAPEQPGVVAAAMQAQHFVCQRLMKCGLEEFSSSPIPRRPATKQPTQFRATQAYGLIWQIGRA